MRADIHPTYRQVVFHDTTANAYFVVGSTIKTDRTIQHEGKDMPYVALDVSSASHVYYTGKQKDFAKEGSAARFNQKFGSFLGAMKK